MQQFVRKRLFASRETFFVSAVSEEFDSVETKLLGWQPRGKAAVSALGMQAAKLPFLSLPYIRKRYFLSLLILVCFPGMGYSKPCPVLQNP